MSWVTEKLHNGYGQSFQASKVLFDSQTSYQRLEIIETALWGRVMLLDGVVQTTEKDEFVYHEMFAHVPSFMHDSPNTVLIIGGGDGGLLREVLKHEMIKKVVLVEIDSMVIDLCSKYLPGHSLQCWEDSRVEVVIADGKDYVRNCKHKFDLILSDSTDPIGPGEVLFEMDFYRQALQCLHEKGIIVTQNGVDFLQLAELKQTYSRMASLFQHNGFYSANVPTYVGGNMSFAWASNFYDCAQIDIDSIRKKFNVAKFATKYYTPEIHLAGFALPRYVSDFLGANKDD